MTDFELAASSYGKDDVRILRLVRDDSDPSSHRLVEYKIRCLLSGPSFTRSYTHADNSMVVATDSIKNILNVMALQSKPEEVLVPEVFALVVMNKFLSDYQHVEGVELDIDMLKWSRISLGTPLAGSSGSSSTVAALPNSQQHPHSFIRDGNEKRFVKAIGKRGPKGEAMVDTLESGLRDLVVLKSTGSAFYDFVTDKYTTLPSVQDRLFSTSVNCQCEF
jgi:urate oxidase